MKFSFSKRDYAADSISPSIVFLWRRREVFVVRE